MARTDRPSAGINNFSCKRSKTDGLVQIFNQDGYLMAEYSEFTGVFRWQRVLMALQKAAVEQWVITTHPIRRQSLSAKA
jgi:hypothetical protein